MRGNGGGGKGDDCSMSFGRDEMGWDEMKNKRAWGNRGKGEQGRFRENMKRL